MLYLIYLLGIVGRGELRAAVSTASWMLAVLVVVFLYFKYVRKILSSRGRRCSPASGAGSKRMPRWPPT